MPAMKSTSARVYARRTLSTAAACSATPGSVGEVPAVGGARSTVAAGLQAQTMHTTPVHALLT
jgi:hypothetical protein